MQSDASGLMQEFKTVNGAKPISLGNKARNNRIILNSRCKIHLISKQNGLVTILFNSSFSFCACIMVFPRLFFVLYPKTFFSCPRNFTNK